MLPSQLVDVFLIHEDINLVFEFCETDLESILMEQSVILKPEHIKCHMRMLLEGLGYLHDNFVLHRVRALRQRQRVMPKNCGTHAPPHDYPRLFCINKLTGSKAQQLAVRKRRQDEAGRFRARAILRQPRPTHDPDGGDPLVPTARVVFWLP